MEVLSGSKNTFDNEHSGVDSNPAPPRCHGGKNNDAADARFEKIGFELTQTTSETNKELTSSCVHNKVVI